MIYQVICTSGRGLAATRRWDQQKRSKYGHSCIELPRQLRTRILEKYWSRLLHLSAGVCVCCELLRLLMCNTAQPCSDLFFYISSTLNP